MEPKAGNSKSNGSEILTKEAIINVSELNKRFIVKDCLGQGGFARVYEFRIAEQDISLLSDDETPTRFAGKVMSKSRLVKKAEKLKLKSEIQIHQSLKHPHIVKYYSYFEDFENVYIIMELCQRTSLSRICKRKKRLDEAEARRYIRQIVSAVAYMHKNNIIHRDLKLSNFLLDRSGKVKVCDFGLAAKLLHPYERKKTICGTPNYIAPEFLTKKGNGHSFEADIWSLGCVLYAMLFGTPPFSSDNVKVTYHRIRHGVFSFPAGIPVSDNARNLIEWLLTIDESLRPSAEELLHHPWFQSEGSWQKSLQPTIETEERENVVPMSGILRERVDQKRIQQKVTNGPDTIPSLLRESSLYRIYIQVSSVLKHAQNFYPLSPTLNLEVPQSRTGVFVSSWVDHSKDTGLAYVLSNGLVGVNLLNNQKLVMCRDGKSFYHHVYMRDEKMDSKTRYIFGGVPDALEGDAEKLRNYYNFILKNLEGTEEWANMQEGKLGSHTLDQQDRPVFVKRWLRNRHSILFHLSNQTLQVNICDHSKVIISEEGKITTYISKEKVKTLHRSKNISSNYHSSLFRRMSYTKDVLKRMIESTLAQNEDKWNDKATSVEIDKRNAPYEGVHTDAAILAYGMK